MFIMQANKFYAHTLVAVAFVVLAVVAGLSEAQDGCKIECYPNTKMINGKGAGKSDNCRWIMRTDGKPARLCDHIKCKKVCPNQAAAASAEQASADGSQAASSDNNMRIEQQLGDENGVPLADNNAQQPMGIMRHMHGNKMGKAIVPGVAGGRLAPSVPQAPAPVPVSGGRRMAPTLPPSMQYDENDTPPPIARFLDISPEE